MPFELPPLPYPFAALEPHIDAKTMEIHHDKHHAAYVNNANAALAGTEWEKKDVNIVLKNIKNIPEDVRQKVINNAGGHANHTFFWEIMGPGKGGEPTGDIADAIRGTFGSFATFKEKFGAEATTRFGSGWAWLCLGQDKKLSLFSTANQDSPIMQHLTPLVGLDVWEHAYYLTYQNRRPDYITAWWNVVNWDKVNEILKSAQ
ncbi:MAG: superoxide dismutase [FCB group bacterium]|jgi:Fe-Mn family superoxide dismutase|nr:superoxide dismutase [FCB group bacterium]